MQAVFLFVQSHLSSIHFASTVTLAKNECPHDLVFGFHFFQPPIHISDETGHDGRHHPEASGLKHGAFIYARGFNSPFEIDLIRLLFKVVVTYIYSL